MNIFEHHVVLGIERETNHLWCRWEVFDRDDITGGINRDLFQNCATPPWSDTSVAYKEKITSLNQLDDFIIEAHRILSNRIDVRVPFPTRPTQTYMLNLMTGSMVKLVWAWEWCSTYVFVNTFNKFDLIKSSAHSRPIMLDFVEAVKFIKKLETDIEILSNFKDM